MEGYERRRGNVTYFSLAQLMIPLLLLLLLHFLSVSPQDETYRDVYRELNGSGAAPTVSKEEL